MQYVQYTSTVLYLKHDHPNLLEVCKADVTPRLGYGRVLPKAKPAHMGEEEAPATLWVLTMQIKLINVFYTRFMLEQN